MNTIKNILVVEDSITQADRLRLALEAIQFNVKIAENGQRALDLLQKWQPDLVISDVMMPEMDGYELCRTIKNDSILQSIPVLLLTSLNDTRDVIKGLDCGANNYLLKPMVEENVVKIIRHLQENRNYADEGTETMAYSILIVEDSPTQSDLLKAILVDNKYVVNTASNGRDALLHIERHRPDVILSDLLMPEMDGFELCQRLKNDIRYCTIPFIVVSELNKSEDIRRAIEIGADMFLSKPITEDRLVDTVTNTLERKRMQHQTYDIRIPFEGEEIQITTDIERVTNFLLATYDVAVTQNRNLEAAHDALIDLNTSLEDRIARRTRELQKEKATLAVVEARFQRLARNAREVIFHFSHVPEPVFEYVSPAISDLCGLSPEELTGDANLLFKMIHTEDRHLLDSMRNGYLEAAETVTLRLICREGKIIWVEQQNMPVNDKQGRLTGYEGIIRNVTEQVKDRQSLEAALDEARRASEMKNQFLANISHEIRTPLNSILGFSDVAYESLKDRLEPDENIYFETIQDSGKRLIRTVHGILDISQLEAGFYTPTWKAFALDQLVLTVAESNRELAASRGLEFIVRIMVKDATVVFDRNSIMKSLIFLIDNAIKFTMQGSITITLDKQPDHFRLVIKDTGIGISEDYQKDLYQIFSQESSGYNKRFQGLGLGLALTRRYLDLNAVPIDLKSREGVGTSITLRFPMNEEQIDSNKKIIPQNKRKSTAKAPRVMLIGEDNTDCQTLTGFVSGNHFDLIHVFSVDEARSKLKSGKIDLLLMDLHLAGKKEGRNLVKNLRKSKKWQALPVIAITTVISSDNRNSWVEAGCDAFLPKPVKPEELLKTIQRYVKSDSTPVVAGKRTDF